MGICSIKKLCVIVLTGLPLSLALCTGGVAFVTKNSHFCADGIGKVNLEGGSLSAGSPFVGASRIHRALSERKRVMTMSGGGSATPSSEESRVNWAVVYGLGFGAITAARICVEAHLQSFYNRVVGMPPALVGTGWSVVCLAVAMAEPIIGIAIDKLRNEGTRITSLLRLAMIPWALLLYFVWLPPSSPSALVLLPVISLCILQAGLNLGFLSLYPSVFPTPEARSKAIVPQQRMVVTGLLLGMTLPMILSREWKVPSAFPLPFVLGATACLSVSILTLCYWEASQKRTTPAPATPTKSIQRASWAGLLEIVQDKRMSRVMGAVFMAQVGNALLTSTLSVLCREVLQPIGPFFGGAIPLLSPSWQSTICFTVFYLLGAITAGWWARIAARIGTVGALRIAMRSYAVGCLALALAPGGMIPAIRPLLASKPLYQFLALLACYIFNGLSLGGLVSLPDVVIAEGVKELEGSGGEGKAGKVYGAKQLVYRLGSATQGQVTALVMYAAMNNWRTGAPLLAGIIPAVCYLCAAQTLPPSRIPAPVPAAHED